MQEGRSAAQVAENKKWLLDLIGFMRGEENIVEPETEPMDQRAGNPDRVEQCQKDDPFTSEAGGGVF